MVVDDLGQGGYFFLEDGLEQFLLILINVLLVVCIDFLPPELLQPKLLLQLVLK